MKLALALALLPGVSAQQLDGISNSTRRSLFRWDPKPLPPNWWEPLSRPGAAPNCSCHKGVFRISGSYGRTNNMLIELTHALAFSVTHTPPLMVDLRNMKDLAQSFDLRAATQGWACVVIDQRDLVPGCTNLYHQRESSARNVYGAPENPVVGDSFRANVLKQVLLRPFEPLRKAVHTFEEQHGLTNGFTAVHLRALENACVALLKRQLNTDYGDVRVPGYVQFLRDAQMDAADVCDMTDRYLDEILSRAKVKHLPMVVAHDRQKPSRLGQISRRYGAVSYTGAMGVFVDVLLLLRASYMIGNPASSMSGNVACVRSLLDLETNFGDPMQWWARFTGHQAGEWNTEPTRAKLAGPGNKLW